MLLASTACAFSTSTGSKNPAVPYWSGVGAQPKPVVLAPNGSAATGFFTELVMVIAPANPSRKPRKTSFSMQGLVAAEHGWVLSAADTRTQSKSKPCTPIAPQLSNHGAPSPKRSTFSALAFDAPTDVVVPAQGMFSQWSYS